LFKVGGEPKVEKYQTICNAPYETLIDVILKMKNCTRILPFFLFCRIVKHNFVGNFQDKVKYL
jgi:hypothetical protein